MQYPIPNARIGAENIINRFPAKKGTIASAIGIAKNSIFYFNFQHMRIIPINIPNKIKVLFNVYFTK